MKFAKRVLGLSLSAALAAFSLAGCSQPQAQVDPGDIAYQTTGISRDTVLYTVGGHEVTADDYLFWLYQSISDQKSAGGLADDAAWAGEIEGVPAAEFLKNDALEAGKIYAVIEKQAADAGVTASEADQQAADAQVDQVIASAESYGYTFQEYLDRQCISEATFRQYTLDYYLNQGIFAKLTADSDPQITADDAKMDAFLEESGIYMAKHILLSTRRPLEGQTDQYGRQAYEDYSEEEQAAVLQEAQALVEQIRAAADPIAEFDKVMNERSDDGRNADGTLASPDGYLTYPGQMVSEFETGAKALDVGAISDPIKSQFGYHIILRLDADNDQTRAVYPQYAQSMLLQQWTEGAKVETTEAFASLDPKSFYDKLTALNEAMDAAKEAQATASPAQTTPPTETPAAE